MTKEILDSTYEIDNFRDKLGEVFLDAFMEDDNSLYEISKSIIKAFEKHYESPEELGAANDMLIAICGYSFEELIKRVEKRDLEGYEWESIIRWKD